MYAWLQQAIDAGAEVVTASDRLARELRLHYDREQVAQGREAWRTPTILSWQAWLASLDARSVSATDHPLCLDGAASTVLWERCIRAHMPDDLLGTAGIVRQAVRAWQRLQEWQVTTDELTRAASSNDERWFAAAARHYGESLVANEWIDSAGLASAVSRRLETGSIDAPKLVVHAGFDRLVPATVRVFECIRARGGTVAAAEVRDTTPEVRVGSFETADAEYRAAGSWARARLERDPDAAIAIVTAELETDARRVARLIREGLAPGWQYGSEAHRTAVNVSYGRRLAEYPAIAIALLVLKWLYTGLSSREVSLLLRAGCIGVGGPGVRSRLELRLREIPDRAWDPASLCEALGDTRGDPWGDANRRPAATDWLGRVATIAGFAERAPPRAAPSVWAGEFARVLAAVGWPGEHELTSPEFQLVNRWRELLNQFARTAIVTPEVTLAGAVNRVSTLAAEAIFQPESAPGLVRVLGVLEAAGMRFDGIWIAGLEARQWPPAATPLALVSRELQRSKGMPDATPADTLEYSRRVLRRLATSAGSVAMSWPRTDGDAELTASALLEELAGAPQDATVDTTVEALDPGWHATTLLGQPAEQPDYDDRAPPIGADERLARGASTVQLQTIEPFQAFAYGRLRVEFLQRFEPGLSPRTRGNLIHDALSRLYAGLPSQQDLRDWDEQDVEDRIGSAIDFVLQKELRYANGVLRHMLELERTRLRQILEEFIAEQLTGPPFSVVGVEYESFLERHGVHVDLRIDRIDRLADDSLLIIDYKSGAARPLLDRQGDLADLQLAAYAAAIDGDVGGVGLINLDSREIGYRIATGSEAAGTLRFEDWQAKLAGWIDEVDDALEEIAAGDARVNLGIRAEDGRPLAILSRVEELRRAL